MKRVMHQLAVRLYRWREPDWAVQTRAFLSVMHMLPRHWQGIDALTAARLTQAMRGRMPPDPTLQKGRWYAVARGPACIDVLFARRDGRFACIQITASATAPAATYVGLAEAVLDMTP